MYIFGEHGASPCCCCRCCSYSWSHCSRATLYVGVPFNATFQVLSGKCFCCSGVLAAMCSLHALPNTAKRNPVLAKIAPNQLENAVDRLLPDSLEAVLDKAASKASSASQAADDIAHAGWFSIPADQCIQQEADVHVCLFICSLDCCNCRLP